MRRLDAWLPTAPNCSPLARPNRFELVTPIGVPSFTVLNRLRADIPNVRLYRCPELSPPNIPPPPRPPRSPPPPGPRPKVPPPIGPPPLPAVCVFFPKPMVLVRRTFKVKCAGPSARSEEHTSELQSHSDL